MPTSIYQPNHWFFQINHPHPPSSTIIRTGPGPKAKKAKAWSLVKPQSIQASNSWKKKPWMATRIGVDVARCTEIGCVFQEFWWFSLERHWILLSTRNGCWKNKRGKRLGGDQRSPMALGRATTSFGWRFLYLGALTVLVFAWISPTERKIWPAMRILRTVGGPNHR